MWNSTVQWVGRERVWFEERQHSLLFCPCLKWRQELISLQCPMFDVYVSLPAQYVRTSQSGISSGTTCQIQKTLWNINQSERWSELPVFFLPPYMVQANWWMSWQPHCFFQSCQRDWRPAGEIALGFELVLLEERWALQSRMQWHLGFSWLQEQSIWMHSVVHFFFSSFLFVFVRSGNNWIEAYAC